MLMTQMKTAITSLIVSNVKTPVGIFVLGLGLLFIFLQIHRMIKERDCYRIVYVLLLIVLSVICLISAKEIWEYILMTISWVRSKF